MDHPGRRTPTAETQAVVRSAAEALAGAGASVTEARPTGIEQSFDLMFGVAFADGGAAVYGGWDDLWHFAARHGYDASAERATEAQAEFEAVVPFEEQTASQVPKKNASKAHTLFRQILENPRIDAFHARKGKRTYVRLQHRGRWQTHSLDGSGVGLLRYILSREAHPPSTQTFNDALQLLRDYARYDAPARDVFVRVARTEKTVYVDLCDETYAAVEIDSDGYRVVDDPPVLFVRTDAMQHLPRPASGGSLHDFKPFFSTGSDDDLRLLVTFMVDVFAAPEYSPLPLLAFDGPPGSAKTTMTKIVKQLTDPQVGGLSAPPKNERDLLIAAQWSRLVAVDNASPISPEMSDAFCRLSTGGGLRTRKLYTDEEEKIFDEQRHAILNGVSDVVKQNDLRDRCLFISASPPKQRRADRDLQEAFEAARPRLLGLLFNAVAAVLASEDSIEIPSDALPRMADFAVRGAACAEALGWTANQFLAAYRANIDQAALDYLENDLVANVLLSQCWRGARAWLRRWLAGRGKAKAAIAKATADERWGARVVWRGSAGALLAYLGGRAGWEITGKRAWPKTVHWFGRDLRMAERALSKAGWEIKFGRTGAERTVVIRRISEWDGEPPDLDDDSVSFEFLNSGAHVGGA